MNQRGMTLLEVLLVLVLSSLFFCTLIPCVTQFYTSIDNMQTQEEVQLDIQTAITFIQDEVKNARAVQVWGSPDPMMIYKQLEVYHDPSHFTNHDTIYLHSIIFQSDGHETQKLQLGGEGDAVNRAYLNYQSTLLLNDFYNIGIQQENGRLIFTIHRVVGEGRDEAYSFQIEEEGKLYIL